MASFPLTILASLLALLSLYAAQKSYIAITSLQQYEERTQKAAKHLDKAADDLYKTRVTQASGAAAVCIHFLSVGSKSRYDSIICFGKLLACPIIQQRLSVNHVIKPHSSLRFFVIALKLRALILPRYLSPS